MVIPWWITVPAFGLAFLVELIVGIRYLTWGLRVRAGTQILLSGKTVHGWWSLVFIPFYLTLPILWIEWPASPVTIAFSIMFAFYFVPYVKDVRRVRYLLGYNFDADAAREEVTKALTAIHEELKLEGHRFLAGDREVLRSIFDPATASFWISAYNSHGRESGGIPGALPDRLRQVPQKKGGKSPWLWRGVMFSMYSVVLALSMLGFAGTALFPELDPYKNSELINAAYQGDEPRVRELLSEGVNPNASEGAGRRALHYAAMRGQVSMAEHLIRAGADVNATDEKGQTPLHNAALYGYEEVVRLLMSHGANPLVKDDVGRTPSDIAKDRGNSSLTDFLEHAATK